jgi:hypothetical protein
MSCNCKNGKTFVNSILPLEGTSTTYVFDLSHFLCGNRKTCVSSAYPINATLSYKLESVEQVGDSAYAGNIAVTGTITYMPYSCNCCNVCPITEGIFTTLVVPLGSETGNTVTGGIVVATAIPTRDCCTITNLIDIESSVTVAAAG